MMDLILIQAVRAKYFVTHEKSILKLVKLQSLLAKCCKVRKYGYPCEVFVIARKDQRGEASLIFGHANANFFVFIDRIRNQFLKK